MKDSHLASRPKGKEGPGVSRVFCGQHFYSSAFQPLNTIHHMKTFVAEGAKENIKCPMDLLNLMCDSRIQNKMIEIRYKKCSELVPFEVGFVELLMREGFLGMFSR